jgi:hypothetical protein
VEYFRIREGKKPLVDFMTSKGYVAFPSKKREKWRRTDMIFIKKGCGYKETRGE